MISALRYKFQQVSQRLGVMVYRLNKQTILITKDTGPRMHWHFNVNLSKSKPIMNPYAIIFNLIYHSLIAIGIKSPMIYVINENLIM